MGIVLDAQRAFETFARGRSLTGRQRDVLELAMRGVLAHKEIAHRLQLEETSVRTHIRALLSKSLDLRVASSRDLVALLPSQNVR
jgi:DNA-binding NarL/FixJ family response regulator